MGPATWYGPADFYDDLASGYDRLYPDWDVASREQGEALHRVLSTPPGTGSQLILDAAVGIGTQLLGLAAHGHRLCGTDISRQAVRRARHECERRRVDAVLGVADMRGLPFENDKFDAVVCADNAVAHLMSPPAVTDALAEMCRVTRAGGRVLVTTRDYDLARQAHPPGTLPQVWANDGGTVVSLQVWDWHADGERYDLQHFQLIAEGPAWRVEHRRASCWAITRDELTACAGQSGLADLAWLTPAESGFFQPMLVGLVPG